MVSIWESNFPTTMQYVWTEETSGYLLYSQEKDNSALRSSTIPYSNLVTTLINQTSPLLPMKIHNSLGIPAMSALSFLFCNFVIEHESTSIAYFLFYRFYFKNILQLFFIPSSLTFWDNLQVSSSSFWQVYYRYPSPLQLQSILHCLRSSTQLYNFLSVSYC